MQHEIVSREEWLAARTALLDAEKKLAKARSAPSTGAGPSGSPPASVTAGGALASASFASIGSALSSLSRWSLMSHQGRLGDVGVTGQEGVGAHAMSFSPERPSGPTCAARSANETLPASFGLSRSL